MTKQTTRVLKTHSQDEIKELTKIGGGGGGGVKHRPDLNGGDDTQFKNK